ncbi:putative 2-aminoethylphosphonate ABC transporter permease subunit [Comamonas sp. Y6]|uniref:2-aminoethylphosphonate ABC transporter permease subunit n=1 Tax=Comamonas resistens TaxID=3046670 RepID=A0ABY8SUE4_9BURK|nr:putative 2-aminoethylphosphonate ABC transporter permease subunit [Comamonas resistens]MDL5036573.1 putative 2-aminoethylphosphonate ABC transporter permease subunit [Comamonas resistens]WHS64911.1 putative 2-aminoethylphosphonate ABC transporter permease subunit [Comamonas resistens]
MSFSTAVLGAASIPSASRKQASGPTAPRQTYVFNWEKLWLGALVLGLLAVLLVAIALPVGTLLGHSFVSADGQFSGLAQFMAYARMLGVGRSLFNSLWLSALSSTLCVALAYGYAYGVVRSCMPLARLFRAIALVPLLAPSLLMAISLIYLFGAQGMLKSWLLGGSAYGPFGIVLGSVLWTFPHALMILCTTLASGDARLYEAAATLGAGRWRSFCQVTLPASRYGLMIAWIVVFVLVVTDFGVPKVIGGNTQMLATDIYKQVIGQQNLSMGAVVAMLLLVPAGLAFAAERHLRAKQAATMAVRAVPLVPQPHAPLDRALLVYCSLIALALLAVMGTAMLASLVSFWPYNLSLSFKHYQFDMMDGGGWASYGNSLTMAAATAVIGALLSFLSAYLVAKPTGWVRARQWLHAVATLPMAVPGLALGLGYILFFNAGGNPLHFLYGSLGILVLCSVAHFFSVAHITQLTALQQLDAEYERVADSMGVPFWTLLWRVHLPVCLPAVMQVAGYFFVNAMTTVSAVVFLYSPETTLASVAVLAMDDAGDIAPAAAMATLIFATAAVGRLLIAALDAWMQKRTQHWRHR